NAGGYSIAVTGADANYTVTPVDGSWTVTPRAITVTADSGQNKTYGDNDPLAFTFTAGGLGLVNGDTLDDFLNRVGGEDVGTYTIARAGPTTANYAITYTGADFTMDPRAVTVAAGSGSSIYGNGATNPGISLTGGTLAFSETLASLGLS